MTISRRTLLLAGIPAAAVGLGLFGWRRIDPHTPLRYSSPVGAGPLTEPAADCIAHPPRAATAAVTEGPFYKPGTPARQLLRTAQTKGIPLRLKGRVLTRDCRPIVGAVIELWGCDGSGVYDNEGFDLRGHQFSDAAGEFAFDTVKPADYRNFGIHRTAHLHAKVQGPATRLLTTQLYFPDSPHNTSDLFFDPSLLLQLQAGPDGLVATFDFVLDEAAG